MSSDARGASQLAGQLPDSSHGPFAFASWASYFATLFFIGAYMLLSLGLIRYIWHFHQGEFSWPRHLLLLSSGIAIRLDKRRPDVMLRAGELLGDVETAEPGSRTREEPLRRKEPGE